MNKDKLMTFMPAFIVIAIVTIGLGGIFFLSQIRRSDPLSDFLRAPINIIKLAEEIGLDKDKFVQDIQSTEVIESVNSQKEEGNQLMNNKVSTPSFFIDDVLFPQSANQTQAQFIENLKVEIQNRISANPEVKPVIKEFFDFNCGFCKSINPLVDQLIIEIGDEIEFKKMNFPFLDYSSKLYAIGYEAAKNQGKENEYAKALFAKR
jgi:protein-disulfide isomerase